MESLEHVPSREAIMGSGMPLSERTLEQLKVEDQDFVPLTWDRLRQIIGDNDLAALRRTPSEVRRYLMWNHAITATHGNSTNFVLKERLGWFSKEVNAGKITFAYFNPTPFADPRDYQILRNDWPYGIDKRISHLLIWTKPRLEINEDDKGDITPAAKKLTDQAVERIFTQRLADVTGDENARDRLLWFKNWSRLQSVKSADHVHVLVLDAPPSLIEEWTKRTSEEKEEPNQSQK